MHLEIGDTFTIGITEEKEIYTWGLNESRQCAKKTDSFTTKISQVKNLSSNNVKVISAGKEHGIMVDEANHLFVWGNNDEGQLGLGNTRKVNSIVVVDSFKDSIKSVLAKDNKNLILTDNGKVYEWPS